MSPFQEMGLNNTWGLCAEHRATSSADFPKVAACFAALPVQVAADLPEPTSVWAVCFILAISCNKQFQFKIVAFSHFCSLGMRFYVLGYIPNRVYSRRSGMRVVGYFPESVLFMVLNFWPSTLGNPHDHIWVIRWAFPARWHFCACALASRANRSTQYLTSECMTVQIHGFNCFP